MTEDPARSTQTPRGTPVPTLADVARAAGVSTATVSRCLNFPDRVLGETRMRVMAAVARLGYAPNFSARALAAKRTNTMGAVIPTMDNAIFARGLQAFQEELGRHGQTLLVASSGYDETLEEEQIRALVARGADALLLIGHHRHPRVDAFLKARNVPVLVAWAYRAGSVHSCIGFDNAHAMAGLARRVLSFGHRRIGMISADTGSNDRARDRVTGARQALAEAGLPDDALVLIETEYGIETGAAALRTLMALPDRPTVVLCGNDVLGIGAVQAAKQMGLRVPEDVSITGFDDIELATLSDPALTTVHVPHREMGRSAAAMLVRMVADKTNPDSVELSTDLRIRRSLGPAPAVAG